MTTPNRRKTGPQPVPPAARPTKGSARTGETVTVACKIPNGIVLHREVEKERHEPVLGGGSRKVPYFERVPGSDITIYGNSRPHGGEFATRVVCGYALTQGVPKDLWDAWIAAHQDMPAVRNRLIFAYPTTEAAADAAREGRKIKSGLEPLDPAGDPRRPRSLNSRIGQIETRDDVAHEFEEVDEEMA